jgi:hypothetical protein
MYRETPFRRLLLGSLLLGCGVSFLDGMLASLTLGMA